MNPILSLAVILAMHIPGGDPVITENPAFVLPETVRGWSTDDSGRWSPETLYQYINGGAELFLSFSFEEAASRRYVRDGEPEITVDIFRMGNPEDAYGVFTMSREKENADVGQGAQAGGGLLLFWKHRYYVSILANPETGSSRTAVRELAHMIEGAIPSDGELPAVVRLLPAEGLRRASIRYFRHHAWQNAYGFIATENILRIGGDTRVAMARYDIGGDAATLFVAAYPDTEQAQEGFRGWCTQFNAVAQAEQDGASAEIRREDRWYTARLRGRHLVLVHDAAGVNAAHALIDRTLEAIR